MDHALVKRQKSYKVHGGILCPSGAEGSQGEAVISYGSK